MLLKYTVENFRSIKDKATFTMIATEDNAQEENLIELPNGMRALKVAEIYGANGSGKTTLMDAIENLGKLVSTDYDYKKEDYPTTPHILRKKDSTIFDCFYTSPFKGSVLFHYKIEFTAKEIISEYLSFSHWDESEICIIKATKTEKYIHPILIEYGVNFNRKSRCSFLRQVFYSTKELDWEKYEKIDNALLGGEPSFFSYAFLTLAEQHVCVHEIGELDNTGLSDDEKKNYRFHQLTTEDYNLYENKLLKWLMEFGLPLKKVDIKFGKNGKEEIFLVYENGMKMALETESQGIKYLVKLNSILNHVTWRDSGGKLLFVDELENHLHPLIVKRIVKYFQEWKPDFEEDYPSQLIFTTHSTELLDLDLVRKDQIWFTQIKQKEKSTELYSLSEFENISEDTDIQTFYLEGCYGAVPIIKDSEVL